MEEVDKKKNCDCAQDEAGNWEWRPILWKNQKGLDAISKRITYLMAKGGKIIGRCHDERSVPAHLAMIRETLGGL